MYIYIICTIIAYGYTIHRGVQAAFITARCCIAVDAIAAETVSAAVVAVHDGFQSKRLLRVRSIIIVRVVSRARTISAG